MIKIETIGITNNDSMLIETNVGLVIFKRDDEDAKSIVLNMISHPMNKINVEEKDHEC